MKMRNYLWTLLLLLSCFDLEAQTLTKKQKQIATNLQKHIQYLASDALEGRRAGDPGEQKAVDYIIGEYEKIHLTPAGNHGSYIQNFPIDEGMQWDQEAYLKVNGQTLDWEKDFITLSNTASAKFTSHAALVLNEKNQVWFKDLEDVLEENAQNPHFDINAWCKQTTQTLAEKGASALFLYNSGTRVDNIQFNKYDTSASVALPVVYITKDGFKKHFKDETATYQIEANIVFAHPSRTAHNIIGYIDNHAPHTVILGAHLDHLGFNQDKHGLDLNNQIHNGADDNASGTAALIELTKSLIKKSPKHNNYLIIHFSAEELGLLGSKYWLAHPTMQIIPNYMINMDMVGRYDSVRKLTLGGFGTSSKWAQLFNAVPIALNTHYDSAGTGPSDHASFYRKDMPVLFLFTGSHTDYHKATDDADKINYQDEAKMVDWLGAIIKEADQYGKFDFLKTREQAMGKSTKFTVSLGVMPDYAFTGTGVRIEGTSQGKIGEKIGLKSGDILVQLGDYKLIDVMSYMQALGKFKKGDKTILSIQRGKESLQFSIEF